MNLLRLALAFALVGLQPGVALAQPGYGASLRVGLPVPLTFYGYTDVDQRPALVSIYHLDLEAAVSPWPDSPWAFGFWVGGGRISTRTATLNPVLYLFSFGPEVLATFRLATWPGHPLDLRLAAGPGLLFHGLRLDEANQRDTVALGGRGSLALLAGLGQHLALMVGVGLEAYGAALNERPWYNERLGPTNFLHFGVGLNWSWPAATSGSQ